MDNKQLKSLAGTIATLSDDDILSLVGILSCDYTDKRTSTMQKMHLCFVLPKCDVLNMYPLSTRRTNLS